MSSQDLTEAGGPEREAPVERGIGPGSRIGRYLVIDRLGEGGMGIVYSAYDPELDRKLAIKLLHDRSFGSTRPMDRAKGQLMNALFGDELESHDSPVGRPLDRDQQRLLREAQGAARINDPSVVTVHDVGEWNGRVFVAMEFVEGKTLRAWSAERARDWREVIEVFVKAGGGLAAAHACGLIHRDFKPDNVMVGDDGRVRVMDFGLVRAGPDTDAPSSEPDAPRPHTDALALDLTAGGSTMGTPAYMSPEQHRGRALDARSDQFSFCVALWEALYGARPFAGNSLPSIAAAILEGIRREPLDDRDVPAAIHRIVSRGLAVDPAERWPTMAALVAALRVDPLRRRNLVIGGVATAAVIAAGVAGTAADRRADLAACRTDAAAIDARWNDDVRQQLRATLAATGATYVDTTATTLLANLDAYAASWSTLTEQVCVADVEGRSASHPDDARACLDERLVELDGMLASLATLDAASVRFAVALTTSIGSPQDCLDPAKAALRTVVGDDGTPVVAEARRRTAGARRLAALRRFDDAATEYEAILAGPPGPVTAWARLGLGQVAEERGDYAASEATLVEAAFEAAAAGDELTVAQAANSLIWVIGYRLGRQSETAYWVRWATVLAARLGLEEDLLGATLHMNAGMMESSRQQYDVAQQHLEHAVAIKRAKLGDDHPEVALVLNSLGTVQMHRGGPDAAEPTWTEALSILERALGDSHPDLATVLGNLAQIDYRRGDFPGARARLERALTIKRTELGPDHPDVARTLTNLGTVMQTAGDLEDARVVLQEARRAFEQALGKDHRSVANTIVALGKVEVERGELDAGIALFKEGLAIQRRVTTPNDVDLAVTMSSIGSALRRKGDLDGALAWHERALEICESHGEDGHPVYTPIALQQLGEIHRLRGDTTQAIALLERALTRFGAVPRSPETAQTKLSLGRALAAAGKDRERARTLLDEARATFDELDDRAHVAEVDAWRAAHPDDP